MRKGWVQLTGSQKVPELCALLLLLPLPLKLLGTPIRAGPPARELPQLSLWIPPSAR